MSKDQRRPRLNSTRRACQCGSGRISKMQTLPGGKGFREVCDTCVTIFTIEAKPIRALGTDEDRRRGAARRAIEERRDRSEVEW